MRPLARSEIVPLEAYAGVRDAFRSAVIAHKRTRRLAVGPNVTLVFEDRETLRFQVQEMLWVERIAEPERVQHELDVYNELMPGARELSATLFVEITEPGKVRAELDRLIGIDEHVALVLGDGAGERALRARFDTKQFEEDRISAVQYIRFALDEGDAAALADPARSAAIRISHPHYAHEAPLPPEVRASLVEGLRADPGSLVPALPGVPTPLPEPEVLFSGGGVRVLRPVAPQLPGHLIVESSAPLGSGGEIDAQLWNALSEAVRRAASDAAQRHGGCRVVTEIAPEKPLRWHILPRPTSNANRS
jgi:hypothetical protein